jgi:hypothetical protein
MVERMIHVDWEGPHPLKAVQALNRQKDYGLYQVYVHHPVYGPGVLAYIGRASDRTFAVRVTEHEWGSGSENDPQNVEIYVGRLKGNVTPSRDQWKRDIHLAEMLLIHAHGPAYNSTHIMSCESDPEAKDVRIINWGAVRALHREVSGLVWTSASVQFRDYKHYGVAQAVPQSQ